MDRNEAASATNESPPALMKRRGRSAARVNYSEKNARTRKAGEQSKATSSPKLSAAVPAGDKKKGVEFSQIDRLREKKWLERFSELKSYKKKNGDCNVPKHHKNQALANWVATQRKEHKALMGGKPSSMTEERSKRLEGLGFLWNCNRNKFDARFEELLAYKHKFGSCHVPKKWTENPALGNWVCTQRKEYRLAKSGKPSSLSEERIQSLNEIGFVWNVHEEKRKENPQVVLSEGNVKAPSTPSGTNDMVQGEAGQSRRDRQWLDMFAALEAYKDKTGNCNVPRKFADASLSNWVRTQRKERKAALENVTSSMTEERKAMLDGIGFVWDCNDDRWQVRFAELKQYMEKHGNCSVSEKEMGVQLKNWIATQRREGVLARSGKPSTLSDDRIKALDGIGFVWKEKRKTPDESKQSKTDRGERPKKKKRVGATVEQDSRVSAAESEAVEQANAALRLLENQALTSQSSAAIEGPSGKSTVAGESQTAANAVKDVKDAISKLQSVISDLRGKLRSVKDSNNNLVETNRSLVETNESLVETSKDLVETNKVLQDANSSLQTQIDGMESTRIHV